MAGDLYTKILLTLITLCLLALVGQQLREDGAGASSPPAAGRYDLRATRAPGGAVLIRLDTVTGRTWSQKVGGDDLWIEMEELEPLERALGDAAEAPAAPAPE
jgi:hypothetical protein